MRYLAAYLLAVLGGNESPSEDDIKRILSSVGIEVDGALLKKVVKELNGKDIEELIAEGRQKLASMPGGGGVYTGGSVATAPAATEAEAPKEEKKAEVKKEESEAESDEDMGFGLFD